MASRRYRLVVYALLAAVNIHARIPTAVGMLLATAVLILVATYETVALARRAEANKGDLEQRWALYLATFVRKGFWPAVIVSVSFFVTFWMNDTRFGTWHKLVDFTHYGFFLNGEGHSQRICAFMDHGFFNVKRLFPNSLFYLFGSETLHQEIIDAFGLSFVRLEGPRTFLILGWAIPLVLFVWFCRQCWRVPKWDGKMATVTVVAALCIGNLSLLAFGTITYRYAADLWAPVLLTTLWAAGAVSKAVAVAPQRIGVYVVRAAFVVMLSFEYYAAIYYLGYRGAFMDSNAGEEIRIPAITDPNYQGDPSQCQKYR